MVSLNLLLIFNLIFLFTTHVHSIVFYNSNLPEAITIHKKNETKEAKMSDGHVYFNYDDSYYNLNIDPRSMTWKDDADIENPEVIKRNSSSHENSTENRSDNKENLMKRLKNGEPGLQRMTPFLELLQGKKIDPELMEVIKRSLKPLGSKKEEEPVHETNAELRGDPVTDNNSTGDEQEHQMDETKETVVGFQNLFTVLEKHLGQKIDPNWLTAVLKANQKPTEKEDPNNVDSIHGTKENVQDQQQEQNYAYTDMVYKAILDIQNDKNNDQNGKLRDIISEVGISNATKAMYEAFRRIQLPYVLTQQQIELLLYEMYTDNIRPVKQIPGPFEEFLPRELTSDEYAATVSSFPAKENENNRYPRNGLTHRSSDIAGPQLSPIGILRDFDVPFFP